MSSKFACIGQTKGESRYGFVNVDSAGTKYPTDQSIIVRNSGVVLVNGRLSDVLRDGAARGLSTDELGPTEFGAIAVAS